MKVLVVGITSEIGEAIAARLVEEGIAVVGTTRDPARTELYTLDVRGEVSPVIDQILADHPDLDGLVYLPAVHVGGALHRLAFEGFVTAMEVNYLGAVRVVQALLPHFIARRSGVIQLVSSTASINGGQGIAPYACSKAALNTLARCISREYGRFGINAFCVLPGYVQAGGGARIEEARRKLLSKRIDVARFATASEVAGFCVATLRNASYLSGNLLCIDGGLHD